MSDNKRVRVKMLTHIIGTPAYAAGTIVELEQRIAKAWTEEGYCRPLTVDEDRAPRQQVQA